jgi:hypothetical protein
MVTKDGRTFTKPPGTIHYQDTDRYRGMFGVPSDSTPDVTYKVSYDSAAGYHICGCMAGTRHGHCKHMDRYRDYGVLGRRDVQEMVDRGQKLPPAPRYIPSPDEIPLPSLPKAFAAAPIRRFARADDI